MRQDCRHCGKSADDCDERVFAALEALAASARQDEEITARVAKRNECCPNCSH